MLKFCRPSICILHSSYSTFKLRALHLDIRRSQSFRRYHSSHSSETIKYTTIIKPKGPRPLRVISTLDPSRLQDSDFVDLSPKLQNPRSQLPSIVSVIPITQQTSSSPSRLRSLLYYAISGVGSRFPENSHGFLYYHRDPQLPPTSGAVRFRLTPDAHASSFSVGTDLMLPDGRSPWAIWLVTIANAVMYVGLKQLLLSDGLVTPELLEHCRHLGARSEVPNGLNQMYHNMLFTLEQPFILDLASSHSFAVVGPQRIERAKLRVTAVQRARYSPRRFLPYSGQCMVRFERSLAPEHAGKRIAVIRVLEILIPIGITDPTFTPGHKGGLFHMPTKPPDVYDS
ncbi:hypothetical protein Hypma_000022 [Hypsizygus marmoreus]|uniref:Uncharacterized protein n=1 Tax=Hypsizygus marmoreus TaxID=39966 RepID=A0A369KDY3_HYPMA|nr:hypothetical protein Hypma_000022 [Hypsizygus marmoreus]